MNIKDYQASVEREGVTNFFYRDTFNLVGGLVSRLNTAAGEALGLYMRNKYHGTATSEREWPIALGKVARLVFQLAVVLDPPMRELVHRALATTSLEHDEFDNDHILTALMNLSRRVACLSDYWISEGHEEDHIFAYPARRSIKFLGPALREFAEQFAIVVMVFGYNLGELLDWELSQRR